MLRGNSKGVECFTIVELSIVPALSKFIMKMCVRTDGNDEKWGQFYGSRERLSVMLCQSHV
jgi:hypothetical protein